MYCRLPTFDDIFLVTLYNGKDGCVNENDGRIWKRLYDEKNKKHTTNTETKVVLSTTEILYLGKTKCTIRWRCVVK